MLQNSFIECLFASETTNSERKISHKGGEIPFIGASFRVDVGFAFIFDLWQFFDNILKLMALEYRKRNDGSKAELVQMDLRAYFWCTASAELLFEDLTGFKKNKIRDCKGQVVSAESICCQTARLVKLVRSLAYAHNSMAKLHRLNQALICQFGKCTKGVAITGKCYRRHIKLWLLWFEFIKTMDL